MGFGNQSVPFAEPAWYSSITSPYYTKKHERLRGICRDHYERHIIPYAADWEARGEVPTEVLEEQSQGGWIAVGINGATNSVEEMVGGIKSSEWDIWCDLIVADEATRSGYLGVQWAFGAGNSIGAPPLAAFGTPEQHERLLRPILEGKKRICLGVTEASGGSDVARIQTTAKKSSDGKSYIVSGAKKWITNGIWADYMTTAVRTGPPGSGAKGISVLVVPLDVRGVTRRRIDNTGVHASGSTYVQLDEVIVPCENLIGKENDGFRILMTNFLRERLSLAIQSNRMARICIEDAYEYAKDREVFGSKLLDQPVIRDKFSSMGQIVTSNHAWIEQICYHISRVPKSQADLDLAGSVALLKVSCTRGLEKCNREALQILGGIGYQRGGRGGRVEQISRDLRVMCVGGGSDEILSDLGLRMEEKSLAVAAKL